MKNNGFTLIEVLIALALIALLSVVAIPNLKDFSNTQELINTSEGVANIIRTAQSSSISRIRCSSTNPSTAWRVQIANADYSLKADCESTPTQVTSQIYSYSTKASPTSSITIEGLTDVCLNQTTDIIFKDAAISYYCSVDQQEIPINLPINITIRDENNHSNFKTITINRGGVVNVN